MDRFDGELWLYVVSPDHHEARQYSELIRKEVGATTVKVMNVHCFEQIRGIRQGETLHILRSAYRTRAIWRDALPDIIAMAAFRGFTIIDCGKTIYEKGQPVDGKSKPSPWRESLRFQNISANKPVSGK